LKRLIALGSIFLIALIFTGCITCIPQGYNNARDCGRFQDRKESIEDHKAILQSLNKDFSVEKLGTKMSKIDENLFIQNKCSKFKDKELPVSKDLARDFKIDLGNFYRHKFCLTYTNNPNTVIYKKEVKQDTLYGYLDYFITDEIKVLDFRRIPISYTQKGYREGISSY